MTVGISAKKLIDFNIKFALDITDEQNTVYFEVNFDIKSITTRGGISEVTFNVNKFSLDPNIPLDQKTNFSAFVFTCINENTNEVFSFHIPVFCSTGGKKALGSDEEEEEEGGDSIVHMRVLLPADQKK
ncbi:hypothetical protein TRFO_22162 [Tritrichomonas foetus]|uniref:Uncharacterized protein n=1 Tax=Tritrichomonas foetus TaxID=1144522 RepID=A0A1J4KCJ3_9EUKA|nr:hypothetical protein TRFO_22162 [Tritrichomonas foetus]|eukprot:OHT09143.1 hypothetical protein TRFO_22162 [Tritrichomonas foetus]